MKRPIFTLFVVLVLALAGGLTAQTYDQATPPSQQVDQSGQPEQPGRPDVDVDTGAQAEGAVDVDVDMQGDADTAASGVDETLGTTDDTTDTAADTDALPGTASNSPLIGLLGLLALAGGAALRASR
jgi:hypothetical protein